MHSSRGNPAEPKEDNDARTSFERKMRRAKVPEAVIDLFTSYLEQLQSSTSQGLIPEEDIRPVSPGDLPHQTHLTSRHREIGEKALSETVYIKLNGGLGTSMGMPYAKSLLEVKPGVTFLDIILRQSEAQASDTDGLPLVFMNSFNTAKDTADYLESKGIPRERQPLSFIQHQYPKILADSLEPATNPDDPELEWNPPGHGDIYAALYTSGILETLLDMGKRYAFVSNSDNLGATVDPALLGYFVNEERPFLMEVALRTASDKKGGHLALSGNGGLLLREIAQCPEKDLYAFQDIQRYGYFNTNNVWLDLRYLKETIQKNGLPRLPLIVNPKTLNPRDESSPKVFQLETALGSAISIFENSGAVEVLRERFIPVKKTNDLLAIRSDAYVFSEEYQLIPSPKRVCGPLRIDLDMEVYKKIDQFEARFPEGPPSLMACESLEVKGDVLFEADVVCKGAVSIRNEASEQKHIARGSVLSGELTLGDGPAE